MAERSENILIVCAEEARRSSLREVLVSAGYEVREAADAAEGARLLRERAADVVLMEEDFARADAGRLLSEVKGSAAGAATRVILLLPDEAGQFVRGLDLGADDVFAQACSGDELLARIRAQMRQKRASAALEERARIADESREVAQTAFQALAVTEKMTRDAFSLDRLLKIGVISLFSIGLVIAAIFVLYSRRADKETKRAYSVMAQLESRVQSDAQLMASTRKMREEMEKSDVLQQKESLLKQKEDLQQQLSASQNAGNAALQQKLQETTAVLEKIQGASTAAEGIIKSYAPSVCLIHVSVAFNERSSGRRLRYGGINSDGSPLKDSTGNTIYTVEGRAPEMRADFFGTGFIVGDGKILTNHHVIQPWWENEELAQTTQQGLEPVIAEMSAYFPGAKAGVPISIAQISEEADLALVRGDLAELGRPTLKLDARKEAAISGQALISLGYATGLDAILARAGDDTVKQILTASSGDPKLVLQELARRGLIRPLVTQGHIGDVLADRIVYDAQTTSGGSGGPLLNRDGQVIGVTFAIVRGFGGSNFGVPVKYAVPLLKH